MRGLKPAVPTHEKVLGSLTTILAINPQLALVSLVVSPILSTGARALVARAARLARATQEAASRAAALAAERLAATSTVKAFGQEAAEVKRYDEALAAAYGQARSAAGLQGATEAAARMAINLGTVALLGYGGWLVRSPPRLFLFLG